MKFFQIIKEPILRSKSSVMLLLLSLISLLPLKAQNGFEYLKVSEIDSLLASDFKNYYESCKKTLPNEEIFLDLTAIPLNIRFAFSHAVRFVLTPLLRNGNDARLSFNYTYSVTPGMYNNLKNKGLIAIHPKIELDKTVIRLSFYLERLRILNRSLSIAIVDSVSNYYTINGNVFQPTESVDNFKDTLPSLFVSALNEFHLESEEFLDNEMRDFLGEDEYYSCKNYLIDKTYFPENLPYDSLLHKDNTFVFKKVNLYPPALRKMARNGLSVVQSELNFLDNGRLKISITSIRTLRRRGLIHLTVNVEPRWGGYYEYRFSSDTGKWVLVLTVSEN